MALRVLNEGALSFASPNWGGSGLATGDDALINRPFGQISGGLDLTALAEGLKSLIITPGATSGRIGGGTNGPLRVDVDDATASLVSNRGNVELFLRAEGDDNLINNLDVGGSGRVYMEGGTVTNSVVTGGVLTANESTVLTNFTATGGSGRIRNNATPITAAVITGGNWTIERVCTLLVIAGNAEVNYDPAIGATFTNNIIEVYGGRLNWFYGIAPTVRERGGIVDCRFARQSFTPGATSWTAVGSRFIAAPNVVTTNRTKLYGSFEVEGSPIPL
jgi:hypothetical protein